MSYFASGYCGISEDLTHLVVHDHPQGQPPPKDAIAIPFSSPPRVGVYFLILQGEVVYVGSSVNVLARVGSHTGRIEFDDARWISTSVDDLRLVESHFINSLMPRCNGFWDPRGRWNYLAPRVGLTKTRLEEFRKRFPKAEVFQK